MTTPAALAPALPAAPPTSPALTGGDLGDRRDVVEQGYQSAGHGVS
jgi:hypothetical protein